MGAVRWENDFARFTKEEKSKKNWKCAVRHFSDVRFVTFKCAVREKIATFATATF